MTNDINQCINVLNKGGLILYPSDTIWGIGCDATNSKSIQAIYELKGRVASKALITLVGSEHMLEKTIVDMPSIAWDLIDQSINPLTIIYDKVNIISKNALAEDGSCGVRLVKNGFCKKLINQFGKPIISTSANVSGAASPQAFAEIDNRILNGVNFIVNFGQNDQTKRKASNIIKLSKGGVVKIIR